MTEYVKK